MCKDHFYHEAEPSKRPEGKFIVQRWYSPEAGYFALGAINRPPPPKNAPRPMIKSVKCIDSIRDLNWGKKVPTRCREEDLGPAHVFHGGDEIENEGQ